MIYRGVVKNGTVILESAAGLPDGTEVQVEPLSSEPTWSEVLEDVIGQADNLPADLARNHDYYIHGTEKTP